MVKEKKKEGAFQEVNTPEFLEALLSGGVTANRSFRKLVEVTHGPLLHYIRRFVFSTDEAQEVLQEVYMGVHKSLPKFQGKSKLTTWIYGMTHNKVCDRLGDRSWQHEEFTEFKNPVAMPENPMSKSTHWELPPDRLFDLTKIQQQIPELIEKLPNNLREIYYLRDVEGLTSTEVAEVTEISEEAVRVRLHRARNKLVELVKEKNRGSNSELVDAKS